MTRMPIAFVLWLATLTLACQPDPPNDGALVVTVRIVADPVGELSSAQALAVDASRVDVVHRTDPSDPSTERVLTVANGPLALSVPLDQGRVQQIAILSVPAGSVSQVRFVTTAVHLAGTSSLEPVKLPSGEQTGLKFVSASGAPFTIIAQEPTTIEGRFDPNAQLNRTKGQGLMLKPTVKAVEIPRQAEGPTGVVPGRVVVSFKPGTDRALLESAILMKGSIRQEGSHLFFILDLSPGVTISEALEFYNAQTFVDLAEPDFFSTPVQVPPAVPAPNDARWASVPGVPGMEEVYGVSFGGAFAGVGARNAWYVTPGSQEVVVALVDFGFDIDHPDLVDNIFINDGELPAEFIADANGFKAADCNTDRLITFADLNCRNCTVVSGGRSAEETCRSTLDDIKARACASTTPVCIPDLSITPSVLVRALSDGVNRDGDPLNRANDVIGWDFQNGDRDPSISRQETADTRLLNHGTGMAGIIGAITNNGPAPDGDVVGTAWNVRIVLLRHRTVAEARNAIAYAAETLHAHVINHSATSSYFAAQAPFATCEATAENLGQELLRSKLLRKQADFAKIDLSKTLLVTGTPNCAVDLDLESVVAWPAEADSTSVAAVSIGTSSRASGASTVDLAGPGNFNFSLVNRTAGAGTSAASSTGNSNATAYASGVAVLPLTAFPELRGRPYCLRELLVRNARMEPSMTRPIRSGGWLHMFDAVTNRVTQPIPTDEVGPCPR